MEGLTWGGSGFGGRVSWSEYRRGQGRRCGPSQRRLGGSGLRQCIEIAEGGGFGGNVMEVLLLSPLLGFMVGFMGLKCWGEWEMGAFIHAFDLVTLDFSFFKL